MKILLPFLLAFSFLLFSCGNNNSKSRKDSLEKLFVNDSAAGDSALAPDADEIVFDPNDGYALAGEIPFSILSYNSYSIPFDFQPNELLAHFFPGKIYKRPDSNTIFSCWSCKDGKTLRHQLYMDEEVNFPREKNETEWLDTISWKQPDGNRYLAFFVQSSEPTDDGGGFCCGRFTPAWVGAAIFRAESSQWSLIAYEPALELSGLFHRAALPEVCVTGQHSFLLRINDYDQGGGGPTFDYAGFYAVNGNHFDCVSETLSTGVGNRMTEWSTEVIAADKNSAEKYPAILLKSSGHLVRSESEEIGENLGVPEAEGSLKSAETLQFTRTQRLEFSNGKYVIAKTEFAADTTWELPPQQ